MSSRVTCEKQTISKGDERPSLRPVSATNGREQGGRDLLLGEGVQDEVTLDRKGLSDDAMFKQGTTNAKTQNRKKQMPQTARSSGPHNERKRRKLSKPIEMQAHLSSGSSLKV